jgi:hypothetical protein
VRSAANERWCVHQRIGTSVIRGPRAASARSIERFAPRRATSEPARMPKSPYGANSAASTQPIRAADPVVASTNHGSATKVIVSADAHRSGTRPETNTEEIK